jgi:hypothetical protein
MNSYVDFKCDAKPTEAGEWAEGDFLMHFAGASWNLRDTPEGRDAVGHLMRKHAHLAQ